VAAQDQRGSTDLDILQLLVKHGVDVVAQDQSLSTLLYITSHDGRLDLAQLLVEHGSNAAARAQGWTPLHLAPRNSRLDVAGFFVKHDVNVATQEVWGDSAP